MAKRAGSTFALVHAWVRKIPRGKVTTYGQLSQLIEGRLSPLAVGWALRAAPTGLPWHRVINSRGELSTEGNVPGLQRALLESEGVAFDRAGRVELSIYQWRPRRRSRPGPPKPPPGRRRRPAT